MKVKKFCVLLVESNGDVYVDTVTPEKDREDLMKLISMKLAHNPNNNKYTLVDTVDATLDIDIPIKMDGTLYWSCFSNNGEVYHARQMSFDTIADAAKRNKSLYPYISVNCKSDTADVINMCLVPGKTKEEAISYCQKIIDKIMRERKE